MTEEMAAKALDGNQKIRRQEAFKHAQQKRAEKAGHSNGKCVAASVQVSAQIDAKTEKASF